MDLIRGIATPATDPARLGGKGAGLAALVACGLDVPPFAVLTPHPFRAHLRRGSIPAAIGDAELALAEPDAHLESASEALTSTVRAVSLDAAIAEAVKAELPVIGPGPYAVRSSMVGEDSARYSYAGQLDSFLSLPTVDDVLDAIVGCWASAFGVRVLAYQQQAGGSVAGTAMSVVIQQMVSADRSGVLFTANPLTGDRDECLVTAAWGLGEGVVSGECDTDEYVWHPVDGERRASIADKTRQVTPAAGRGTSTAAVDDDRRRARCLSGEDVERLCKAGRSIADRADRPMDVEWSLQDGRLWILQARPVTGLPPIPAPGMPLVWDNANIQESYNGVTLPLSFTVAARAYRRVYRTFARTAGVPPDRLDGMEPTLRNMVSLIDGRVYYNLNNWYRLISLFPGFAKSKEDMEKMMGVEEPVDFVEDPPDDLRARWRHYRHLVTMGVRIVPRMARLEGEIERFCTHFDDVVVGKVDRDGFEALGLEELHGQLDRLLQELTDRWDTPIANDFRVMWTSGGLRRTLAAIDPERADELYIDLLSGIDGLESAEPTRRLMALAKVARDDPALSAAIRERPPAEVLALLEATRGHERFREGLDAFVARYGDRVMGEQKLETITLRQDRSFAIDVIRNYLGREDVDPDAMARRERERYQSSLAELERRLAPRARRRLRRQVAKARQAVAARERLRLLRTIGFGLLRHMYLAMGTRLAEAGRIETARDVLYLTAEEIEAFVEGRAVSLDLAGLVALRQAEYDSLAASTAPDTHTARTAARRPPPDRFTTPGSPYLHELTRSRPVGEASMGAELAGLAASSGVVEAPVRVILDPSDDMSVNGNVICTIRTDPGWAPLFPTCSGLITERGSTLSHSAVIAREMGIPAVVGVPGATTLLPDGSRVRVDGVAGKVQLLDHGEAGDPVYAAPAPEDDPA